MEDRVRQYMESQSAPPAEPAAPIVPPPPQRVWTDVLAGFMEEKNIRWGELVGGLLIVCCSIALVISFWAKIAERPFLKFFVFGGVTAALFAVGFYTEQRWKLRTTSRGLLVIATLLVPLNFLAIAAFDQEASRQVAFIAGELISVALFAALVWAAGRILVPLGAVALAIGVMVPAVLQLIERRLVGPSATWPLLYGLGAIPLVCYGGANGWLVAGRSRQPALDEAEAHSLFRLLGLTTFSILLPLGLLAAKTGDPVAALHRLSPLLCALGLAPLVIGLLVARRLRQDQPSSLRVAGTSIAIAGAAISLAALLLAWPDPAVLLPAVIAEIILFEAIAHFGNMPAAHVVAVASAALGYLIGVYLLRGEVGWWGETTSTMRPILWSGMSGAALAPLVALLALVGWSFQWRGRRVDALFIGGATATVAGVSLLLVSWFGAGVAGDPLAARWVYAVYAAAALAVCGVAGRLQPRSDWPLRLAWLGSLLLLAAIVQGIVFRWAPAQQWNWPWPAALAAHAGLMALLALSLRWIGRGSSREPLAIVAVQSALASSCVAAGLIAWGVHLGLYSVAAANCVALAAIWLALAVLSRSPPTFWWCKLL